MIEQKEIFFRCLELYHYNHLCYRLLLFDQLFKLSAEVEVKMLTQKNYISLVKSQPTVL